MPETEAASVPDEAEEEAQAAPVQADKEDSDEAAEPDAGEQAETPEESAAPEPAIRFIVQAIPETDGACVITGLKGNAGDRLAVPDEIDGMNVIEIGKRAFAHGAFREVRLPDSLQRIGDYAFMMCMGLGTIDGGRNIREIGRGVFNGCLHLEKCAFLSNAGLRRPDDPMLDRIIQKLNSEATAENGGQA